jgi:hypothetical protein
MFILGVNCVGRDDNKRINFFESGDKEKERGLTYVDISRIEDHAKLNIGSG